MDRGPTSKREEPGATDAPATGVPALMVLAAGDLLPIGTIFPLGTRTALGRGPGVDIVLDSDSVSRRHCEIVRDADGFRARDLGSTNGTFVDGERVEEHRRCAPGALLRLGSCLFSLVPDAEAWRHFGRGGTGCVGGPLWRRAEGAIDDLARHDDPVVLHGESGTGKELLAERLHRASGRAGRFVPVNCAAIPTDLAEATLFGHVRGAFTGAVADARGLVRAAEGGTLFLDEVAELPPPLQAKLLRVLDGREFLPLGASRPVTADVRVVCATHRDLAAGADAGWFRGDLYYRLAGAIVRVPALRERREDVALLVESARARLPDTPRPTVEALERLCLHAWPGNVREALAAVRSLLVEGQARGAPAVASADVARRLSSPSPGESEEARIVAALRAASGNVARAARATGLSRRAVYRVLDRLGRRPEEFRPQ